MLELHGTHRHKSAVRLRCRKRGSPRVRLRPGGTPNGAEAGHALDVSEGPVGIRTGRKPDTRLTSVRDPWESP
ncbi:hypothetical protein EYF80_065729 [Liparis tanakae]|uniref:Uncharacterized protein n=1 Tax=Liparis tanakae TaxID=230148 RepID=A0A4Z2E5T4_9TELE|nr:hypothetical protein EYF80_065729 [Liparis tanakae]